jgi:hypothetical protein
MTEIDPGTRYGFRPILFLLLAVMVFTLLVIGFRQMFIAIPPEDRAPVEAPGVEEPRR